MAYYDELLSKLDNLLKNKKYLEVRSLIDDELSLPYVPKDILNKLQSIKDELPKQEKTFSLSDEEIINKLKSDNQSEQLIAVEYLDHCNLRDYSDIINDFLKSDGLINAKVLLIESLIKQEISGEFTLINNGMEYNFIPRYIMLPEESLGYTGAIKLLNDIFMKEPSQLIMSKQLLYKECLLALPLNYDESESELLANKVSEYVKKAFNA